MKSHQFLIILFLCFLSSFLKAQVTTKYQNKIQIEKTEQDSILKDTVMLPELIISKEKWTAEEKKQFLLLQYRVLKVYPYAKLAAERLTALNKGMEKLTSNHDKKVYLKIVEEYLTEEFEEQLKKLSMKQGQILVKLIYRQTGITTYDLIANLKSNWKAFWSNATAHVFHINLKAKYQPYEVNEDYLIETILMKAFAEGKLYNQKAANPVDYEKLIDNWQSKPKNNLSK